MGDPRLPAPRPRWPRSSRPGWKGGRCRRAVRGGDDHLAYRRDRRRARGEVRGVACAAIAARTGQPCRVAALTGSDYCLAHDPATRPLEERLADARARSPRNKPRQEPA